MWTSVNVSGGADAANDLSEVDCDSHVEQRVHVPKGVKTRQVYLWTLEDLSSRVAKAEWG